MASQIIKTRLKRGGRAVFFVLLLIQCGFLTAYPVYYKGPAWSPVFISYAPVCLIWLYSLYKRATELRTFFVVWAFYIVCALLTNVLVVFGFVVESIDKEKFLGPNVLKVVLCITPVLLVLLMVTADNGEETDRQKEVRRELVAKLCTQMAIDLLDTIEVLDIILEDAEHNDRNKLKGFGTTMTAVACLSFVLTLMQMTEIKFNNDGKPEKTRYTTTLLRTAAEMVFVNFIFWRVLTVVVRLFRGFGAVVAFPGKARLRRARSWPREPTMGRLRAWRRSFKTSLVRAVKSSPLADGRFACWERRGR